MSTAEKPLAVTPEMTAELERAIDNATKGVSDPEAKDRAAERMDRIRDKMRRRVGEVDLAVPLIREARDG